MIRIKLLAATTLAAGLLFGTQSAFAHCDSIDGPVAQAALRALDTGNVGLILPYAPATAEAEIEAHFGQALKVRALGSEAKGFADRAFMETAVRLHRAGEGAAYTGLKPVGMDFGPVIPVAEKAIASGDLDNVRSILVEELQHGLNARFEHVLHTRSSALEPKSPAEVAAARERVSAELGFVTFAEGMRQAAAGALGHEHRE